MYFSFLREIPYRLRIINECPRSDYHSSTCPPTIHFTLSSMQVQGEEVGLTASILFSPKPQDLEMVQF